MPGCWVWPAQIDRNISGCFKCYSCVSSMQKGSKGMIFLEMTDIYFFEGLKHVKTSNQIKLLGGFGTFQDAGNSPSESRDCNMCHGMFSRNWSWHIMTQYDTDTTGATSKVMVFLLTRTRFFAVSITVESPRFESCFGKLKVWKLV